MISNQDLSLPVCYIDVETDITEVSPSTSCGESPHDVEESPRYEYWSWPSPSASFECSPAGDESAREESWSWPAVPKTGNSHDIHPINEAGELARMPHSLETSSVVHDAGREREMSSIDEDDNVSVASMQRDNLLVDDCGDDELGARIDVEVGAWPADEQEAGRQTFDASLQLVAEALTGCMVVISPKKCLQRLNLKAQSVDRGYMSKRLAGHHVQSAEFRRAFLDFTSPGEKDRWPRTCSDQQARGLPKDGATLLSAKGFRAKGAAQLLVTPGSHQWEGKGTRHGAAVAASERLEHSITIVRSEGGDIHILLGAMKGIALRYRPDVPAPVAVF